MKLEITISQLERVYPFETELGRAFANLIDETLTTLSSVDGMRVLHRVSPNTMAEIYTCEVIDSSRPKQLIEERI